MGTVLRFDVADEADQSFAPIQRFFRHHVGARPPAGNVNFRIAIEPFDVEVARLVEGETTTIRRSTAPPFNFQARCREEPDRWIYANGHTMLVAPRRCQGHGEDFSLHVSPDSRFQTIDFIRDLVIRHQESLGTVILHASGVCREGTVTLNAGRKAAGKTTALLGELSGSDWRYFTGDKAFCSIRDDEIFVTPWRDWPHVGVGTVRAFDRFHDWVRSEIDADLARRADHEKILLDPDRFEKWLGVGFSPQAARLGTILLPELRTDRRLEVREIYDLEAKWAYLNQIVERSCDTTFFAWQTYLVPDYAAVYQGLSHLKPLLEKVRFVRARGELKTELAELLETRPTGHAHSNAAAGS